ncbi:MAG: DUF1566 domain-containing protein [Nitrospirota bacterium]
MVAFGAVPTNAATANGPYYATPSWDQKLQCDTTETCPRFIVLSNWNNEAVLDRETGLVWERTPTEDTDGDGRITKEDRVGWYGTPLYCNDKNVGGRKGWRVPTIQELASLVDPTQEAPSLPWGHPFSLGSTSYWSATVNYSNPNNSRNLKRQRLRCGISAVAGSNFPPRRRVDASG